MSKRITSASNKEIKYLNKLLIKSSFRKKERKFVVEGKREIIMAVENGFKILKLYYNPNIIDVNKFSIEIDCDIIELSDYVYSKISYRKSTEGLIAVYSMRDYLLKLDNTNNNLALVLDGIEKPGNLGAILRTCDAINVSVIILTNHKCDIFNPNVIRSSLGAVFSKLIITMRSDDAYTFFKKNNYSIFSTSSKAKKMYDKVNFKKSCAIVVGSEKKGISDFWKEKCCELIKLPMLGLINSLNVSVSAAIILYEVNRQRNGKKNSFK